MDKKIVNPMDASRIDAKEKALPAGGWKSGPYAGDTLIAHKDYVFHTDSPFRYKFKDIASFTEYCNSKLDPNCESMIFYTGSGLIGFHDYRVPSGNRVYYDFEISPELRAWTTVQGFSHKRFKAFLEERLDELVDVELFSALTTLKLNTTITFQSDLEDDRNYGFIYEEKSAKGSSKIPKYIGVKVPFFTSDPVQEIPMKVMVKLPKNPDEKPHFTMEVMREKRLLADNVARLITDLRKALPDHMILHGNTE